LKLLRNWFLFEQMHDNRKKSSITGIALTVALGGLLMGFDASVISGVIKFIEIEFDMTKFELGFAVSSLTVSATAAMLFSGALSDWLGRRTILRIAAVLFAVSAIFSALAPNYATLVIARMIGGFGVGASLILAPMYIAEIAPAKMRGRLVSFNQLNIVIGISLAFITNYLILQFGQSGVSWAEQIGLDTYNWRWMLGLETLPAVVYFAGLFLVPVSPRWLMMKNRRKEAEAIMSRLNSKEQVEKDLLAIEESIRSDANKSNVKVAELFSPAVSLVLTIGIAIAILQQITGINSVFFYAPMIFEQSGIGTDASFVQAILVGLTNLLFTVLAMAIIDRFGRKPLLIFGVTGIAISMFLLAYGFNSATYKLTAENATSLSTDIDWEKLCLMMDVEFDNDVAFKNAIKEIFGVDRAREVTSDLIKAAINMNPMLILIGILGFVASFAVSLGPVMWVLFAELFPNRIRGIAISFVGLINSAVSTGVQFIFPWEIDTIGNAATFLIYGAFAVAGLIFILKTVPETKGKTLEQLEKDLIKTS
jgi:SP family arabinose:H+ symporter-like MFS transporter